MRVSIIAFVLFLICLNLYASDDESIDNILNDISTKTDLSEKTKLENGGISFIYTRNDLERMQAKNLKDILKTVYPFGYNENRYGFADPLTFTTDHPFLSSSIRVFIDNQEITTGYSGSGLFVVGDMDIDFVDHIEIYSLNPTYEYSTEPTMILIKLYSKVAQKDQGGKVRIGLSSHNSSSISGYYSDELDEWSYFSYASYNEENKDKYRFDRYSKDRKYINVFGSIYNDNNRILVQALHQNRDGFISQKFDVDLHDDYFDSNYLHIGYDGNINNFSFAVSYDYFKFKQNYFADSTPLLNMLNVPSRVKMTSKSNVLSLEAKYKYNMKDDRLLFGLKYRYKDYEYLEFLLNNINIANGKINHQTLLTAFLENQYDVLDNAIITAGINYSRIKTPEAKTDEVNDLLMYRLGFTYTPSLGLTSKTIFSHNETLIDFMYVDASYYVENPSKIKTMKSDFLLENIVYNLKSHKFEIIMSYLRSENALLINNKGRLYNSPNIITGYGVAARDTFRYRDNDKLFIEISYNNQRNIPKVNQMIKKRVVLRNLNTFGKFDIFNELFYLRDSKTKKNFYDYSAGVIYHHNQDLSFALKGQNIFNKAKTTDFMLIDPNTLQKDTVVEVPSVEQRFMLSMEYLF